MSYKNPKEIIYNIDELIVHHDELKHYVIDTQGHLSINFSDQNAVFHLNKALLKAYYDVKDWQLPKGYLCPGIPGRMHYLNLLNKLVDKDEVHGIDIGTGASAIYCILAAKHFKWKMNGIDSNPEAYNWAKKNISLAEGLEALVSIKFQDDNSNILTGALDENCFYDFTMCNPPFYSSEKEAVKANTKKITNLKLGINSQNIGHAKELWCNGGEALFIKRMIKESMHYKEQVHFFTSLVSNKKNVDKLVKLIRKCNAKESIETLKIGNKTSHVLIWQF